MVEQRQKRSRTAYPNEFVTNLANMCFKRATGFQSLTQVMSAVYERCYKRKNSDF